MNGDIGQAFEWLRKRGIAKASAMADRSANEGASNACTGPCRCNMYGRKDIS